VQVGPYAIIDEGVELDADCLVGPHVHLTGITTIGPGNRFFTGCVIGEAPQDLKYDGRPTRLRIGADNIFREHATVHRSTTPDGETLVGSRNFIMANSHVAHNCQLGDSVILANGALLAGHVRIADRAFISGNCIIHQGVRIGTLALMQGGSAISLDLPPYTIAQGGNGICGLNTIGLRRAGFSSAQRLELQRAYRKLFRDGLNLREAITQARDEFKEPPASELIEFVATSKRGVCSHLGGYKSKEPADATDED